jgi:hypothetical protein
MMELSDKDFKLSKIKMLKRENMNMPQTFLKS